MESSSQFEQRKRDHIRLALDPRVQTAGGSLLESLQLIPEALPQINFDEVDISTKFLNHKLKSPVFVSSMTAGHSESIELNRRMLSVCQKRGWMMGVGSQRKELFEEEASREWAILRREFPQAILLGNVGITQVIQTPVEKIQKLVDNLQAQALFVHTNPLQEALQPEGTPQFKGSLEALKNLVKKINVPVILKEVGCGISTSTLEKLHDTGLFAVDLGGFGGTHWGRLEGYRSEDDSLLAQVAETFKDWGVSSAEILVEILLETLLNSKLPSFEIWASGGVRTGLDAIKLLALGAKKVGMAQPVLKAALLGEEKLDKLLEQIELEMKIALFCTGLKSIEEMQNKKVWKWKTQI